MATGCSGSSGGFSGGADTLSDAGGTKMFIASLGYGFTGTATADYHSIPVGVLFRPCGWAMLQAGMPLSVISGSDTYNDEILVGGVPTPRTTTFYYDRAGIGDVSISAWIDAASIGCMLLGSKGEPGKADAGSGAGEGG